MILIKITKENREPKVGEWCKYFKIEDDWDLELNPGLKALSLSVILDAPHWLLDLDWEKNYNKEAFQSYPISNSEEIFQWLHDQGKLGKEWVEWEGESYRHKASNSMSSEDVVTLKLPIAKFADLSYTREPKTCTCPAPLIRGVEYCGICEKDFESEKDKFISKVSKISETGEDEFKAEFNSPELIWGAVKELIRRYNRAFKI